MLRDCDAHVRFRSLSGTLAAVSNRSEQRAVLNDRVGDGVGSYIAVNPSALALSRSGCHSNFYRCIVDPQLRRRMKDIDGNQNDVVLADVAMVVRGVLGGCRCIPGMQDFLGSLRLTNFVGSLYAVDHCWPIFVAVNTNIAARLDREHAHPQLPTRHTLNFRTEIDKRGFAGGEPLIAFRNRVFRIGRRHRQSKAGRKDRADRECLKHFTLRI